MTDGLKRALRLIDLFSLAFGAIIGWGVFTLTADWFEMSGPWGTFIAAYVAMLMILPVAMAYAELIPCIPESGGEYKWAYAAFGKLHGAMAGWWLYTGYVSIVLLNATAFPIWLRIIVPQAVEWGYLYTVGKYNVYLGYIVFSVLILTAFFFINYRGIRLTGTAQTLMSLLLVLGGFSYIAMCMARGDVGNTLTPSPWSLKSGPLESIVAWLAIAPWAYVGFDTVPQAIEETKESPRRAFLVMTSALLVGATFYAFITLATAFVKPWSNFLGTWLATASAAMEVGGGVGVGIVLMAALMGILTGINGFMYASSRLLFAMSRDEVMPRSLSEIHERHGTPHKAITLTYALALIGPLFGRDALLWFVNVASFGTAFAYLHAGLSLCKLREKVATINRKSELYMVVVGSTSIIVSLTFIALLIYQLWIMYSYGPLIAITAYTLIGLALYKKRSLRESAKRVSKALT